MWREHTPFLMTALPVAPWHSHTMATSVTTSLPTATLGAVPVGKRANGRGAAAVTHPPPAVSLLMCSAPLFAHVFVHTLARAPLLLLREISLPR